MLMPLELRHYSWKQSTINDNHEDRIQLVITMQCTVTFDRVVGAEIPNNLFPLIDVGPRFIAHVKFVTVENLEKLYRNKGMDQGESCECVSSCSLDLFVQFSCVAMLIHSNQKQRSSIQGERRQCP